MNFLSELNEISEVSSETNREFSNETLEKYDKLLEDDKLETVMVDNYQLLKSDEIESKFSELCEEGDFFTKKEVETEDSNTSEIEKISSVEEIDSKSYEIDENGDIYKQNSELLPDKEYVVNGNTYRTDENGRIVSCDSEPSYTEGGSRNLKEQKESGGEDRQDNDDGGHIIAKVLGGAEGEENIVPMRRTINRGDYKKMENEMSKALQEGKQVYIHTELEYNANSSRPSKIKSEYTVDSKNTILEFDNNENSTNLLDSLSQKIQNKDYLNLNEEIEDMKADGIQASITSIKSEYAENDNLTKVTVGVLDESTGEKTYKVYEPK